MDANRNLALSEVIAKLGDGGWSSLFHDEWADLISGLDDSCFRVSPFFLNKIQEKADELDVWNDFDSFDWVKVLKNHPSFSVKCDKNNGWKTLSFRQRVLLLTSQPHFLWKFDGDAFLKNFDGFDWVVLLREQPRFADKCDKFGGWDKIDFGRICLGSMQKINRSLYRQQVFKTHGTLGKDWSYCGRWAELLECQPQFASKCSQYNGWEAFDGFDWWRLIATRPEFAEKCREMNGWRAITDYRAQFIVIGEYDSDGQIFYLPGRYDYESLCYTIPEEYSEIFSRNSIFTKIRDYSMMPHYKFQPRLYCPMHFKIDLDNGSEYYESGYLPIPILYYDAYGSLSKSYWINILKSDLRDDMALGRITIEYCEKNGILTQLSREDWNFILDVHNIGASHLNSAARFSSLAFWNSLLNIWPECISDANFASREISEREDYGSKYCEFTGWAYLFRFKPELVRQCSECNGWQLLDKDSWVELLDSKWSFLDKVDSQDLSAEFWREMLKCLPENAPLCDKYNGWSRFDKDDWLYLIGKQEQLVQILVKKGLLCSFGWTNKEDVLAAVEHLKRLEMEVSWSDEAPLYDDYPVVFPDELGQMYPNEGY